MTKIIVAGFMLIALEVAWLGRWEVIPNESLPIVYQLDRWTGNVYLIQGLSGRQLTEGRGTTGKFVLYVSATYYFASIRMAISRYAPFIESVCLHLR